MAVRLSAGPLNLPPANEQPFLAIASSTQAWPSNCSCSSDNGFSGNSGIATTAGQLPSRLQLVRRTNKRRPSSSTLRRSAKAWPASRRQRQTDTGYCLLICARLAYVTPAAIHSRFMGPNYKKILRLSYDVIITYDNRKSNLR